MLLLMARIVWRCRRRAVTIYCPPPDSCRCRCQLLISLRRRAPLAALDYAYFMMLLSRMFA